MREGLRPFSPAGSQEKGVVKVLELLGWNCPQTYPSPLGPPADVGLLGFIIPRALKCTEQKMGFKSVKPFYKGLCQG